MPPKASKPSFLTRARNSPWQVAGAFLLIWASMMLVMTGSAVLTEWRYAKDGQEAEAIVTSKHLVRAEDDPQSMSTTLYQVAYRFRSGQGAEIEGHDTVGPETWERLRETEPIAIEYLRGNPGVNRRAGHKHPTDMLVAACSVVVWIAGVLLFLTGVRKTRGRLQAVRATAAPGVPIAVQRGSDAARASRESAANERKPRHSSAGPPSLLKLMVNPKTYFPVILVVFGGSFFLTGGFPVYQEYRFRISGREVEGLVLSKGIDESYSAGARSPIGGGTSGRTTGTGGITRTHWVSYKFTTSDGRTMHGQDEVNGKLWAPLREQGPIPIDYVPDRPGWNRIVGHRIGLTPLLISLLGFAFMLGGVVLFVYGVRDGWTKYHRLRRRTLVEARVTEIREAGSVQGTPQWAVHYQFNDQAGQACEGETVISDADADEVEAGTRGYVRPDVHQPDKMIWVGKR
jgi:hypothetical protein